MEEKEIDQLLSSVRAFVTEQSNRFQKTQLYTAKMIIACILQDIREIQDIHEYEYEPSMDMD